MDSNLIRNSDLLPTCLLFKLPRSGIVLLQHPVYLINWDKHNSFCSLTVTYLARNQKQLHAASGVHTENKADHLAHDR